MIDMAISMYLANPRKPPVSHPNVFHLRVFSSLSILKVLHKERHDRLNSNNVIEIVQGFQNQIMATELLNEAMNGYLLVPLAEKHPTVHSNASSITYRCRMVSNTDIDYPHIISWINECHRSKPSRPYGPFDHGDCASTSLGCHVHKVDFATRVIDCRTRRIVPPEKRYNYVALSYVWGLHASESPDERALNYDHMPSVVPQTIEDAMLVVRNLSKKYL